MSDPTLQYPNLDLFVYDLQDGLGQSAETIQQKRQQLWQGILNGQLTAEKLATIQAREETLSDYIELLQENGGYHFFEAPYDGYYYPVKLGDTIGVLVGCTGKPDDPNWKQFSFNHQLQQIKQGVEDHARNFPSVMGRNWLVWGQLVDTTQTPEAVAKDLYKSLKLFPEPENILPELNGERNEPNWERDRKGSGRYQGATLFEIQKRDQTPDGINQNHHALICLFPPELTKAEIQKTIGKLYRHLICLFHYRNKVLWAYEQGFQLKTNLKKASSEVGYLTDQLPQHIVPAHLDLNVLQDDLAQALKISYGYETDLGFLKEQASTIKINIDNYQHRLESMGKNTVDTDLEFLKRFSDFALQKYFKQLQNDEEILRVGLKPLENFITTVSGIIDIEKTKNERTLNKTIAITSVGISVASLTASTFNDQAKQIVSIWMPPPKGQNVLPINGYWTITGLALAISLSAGLIAAFLTWLVLKRRPSQ